MNRKHTVEQYVDVCDKILKNNPEVKFSSDFIVSYPGEEQCDFEDTLNLIKKIKFINSFSFIFSPRPGTKAGEFETIDNNISKDKLIEMQNLLFKYQIQTNKSYKDRTVSVLIENKMNNNKLFGRNKYLNSVICDGPENRMW